jgi:SAM-dependent methyltransferase
MIVHADDYYASIGALYDRLKAGDNLQRWADLVIEAGGLDPLDGRTRLLDLGCGTGASSRAFLKRGFAVTGCDISAEMLRIARERDDDVRFVEADIRALPADLCGYDVVNFMGDVPNHLEYADFVRALRCASRAVNKGGIVVFDVNTMAAYSEMFARIHVIERLDSLFIWIGETVDPREDEDARMRLIAFQAVDGNWQRTEASLTQHHHGPAAIREALEGAALEFVVSYGLHNGSLVSPPSETQHMKVIYVARKG